MTIRVTSLLMFLAATSCGHRAEHPQSPQQALTKIPVMAATVRGELNFGDHVMIYGDHAERFVWGIVFPRDTLTSISSTEVPDPRTTIKLRSGITLGFVNNEVTVTKLTNTMTMTLKPQTIYLMHENLSTTSSTDLTGIRLVSKRVWSRWATNYITTYDLILPQNLPKRFGKHDF